MPLPHAGRYLSDMARPRLSPEKWLNAGMEALVAAGPSALAAEPLARRLGTTKGSFYWHFKDVPAFQDAVLQEWRGKALGHVVALLQERGEADQRLRKFGRDVLNDGVEANLRIWANGDTRVRSVLEEVDAERLRYLTQLLAGLGLGNPDFARALQASLIGLPQIAQSASDDGIAPFDTLVDTILALA